MHSLSKALHGLFRCLKGKIVNLRLGFEKRLQKQTRGEKSNGIHIGTVGKKNWL